MFIHNYSHTFFLLLRGPISQVVLHDCRQRDVSQTLMSIHGWVRGFRMCKTSSLQLLLGQLGTPVGSHPSERRWRTFIGQEEHEISNMVPYFPDFVAYCGKRGSWLVARIGITPCSGYISFHLSKEQSCSSISNEDIWLVTSRMVRV